MGQPIFEVQLNITMTPYEAELFDDIIRDFTTNKRIAMMDKLSNGEDITNARELLVEYQALIDKISKHTTTIQE